MDIKFLSVSKAFDLATDNNVDFINCEPKFVAIISETFNVKPICIVVFNVDKPLLGLILYVKNGSIIHPTTYIYTSIWKTSNSSILIENALISIIKKLQKKYKNISLLLPPSIVDIRPFIYCGFKSDVKYTYINDLLNIKLSSDVKSMRNKAEKLGINFKFNEDNEDILNQNVSSFIKLGYSKKYIIKLNTLICKLKEAGYLKPISATLNDELIASGYVLLDKQNLNAMNLFVTSNKSNYQTGVHSSLYLQNLYSLREQGFLTNDLFGATTKGIGNFKSNFNGELRPYYHVRYNYVRWGLVRLVNKIRSTFMMLKSFT